MDLKSVFGLGPIQVSMHRCKAKTTLRRCLSVNHFENKRKSSGATEYGIPSQQSIK